MSVSDEVSISATSLSQSSKYSIDPGTLLAAANAPTKFGEFKYSLAYEVYTEYTYIFTTHELIK